MIEGNRFAVPPEIEEILDHLPLHVTLNVPDHILSIWFPPVRWTVAWRGLPSSARKPMRRAAHASSTITKRWEKGYSTSRYRQRIEIRQVASRPSRA
jgi:hypothetical protein